MAPLPPADAAARPAPPPAAVFSPVKKKAVTPGAGADAGSAAAITHADINGKTVGGPLTAAEVMRNLIDNKGPLNRTSTTSTDLRRINYLVDALPKLSKEQLLAFAQAVDNMDDDDVVVDIIFALNRVSKSLQVSHPDPIVYKAISTVSALQVDPNNFIEHLEDRRGMGFQVDVNDIYNHLFYLKPDELIALANRACTTKSSYVAKAMIAAFERLFKLAPDHKTPAVQQALDKLKASPSALAPQTPSPTNAGTGANMPAVQAPADGGAADAATSPPDLGVQTAGDMARVDAARSRHKSARTANELIHALTGTSAIKTSAERIDHIALSILIMSPKELVRFVDFVNYAPSDAWKPATREEVAAAFSQEADGLKSVYHGNIDIDYAVTAMAAPKPATDLFKAAATGVLVYAQAYPPAKTVDVLIDALTAFKDPLERADYILRSLKNMPPIQLRKLADRVNAISDREKLELTTRNDVIAAFSQQKAALERIHKQDSDFVYAKTLMEQQQPEAPGSKRWVAPPGVAASAAVTAEAAKPAAAPQPAGKPAAVTTASPRAAAAKPPTKVDQSKTSAAQPLTKVEQDIIDTLNGWNPVGVSFNRDPKTASEKRTTYLANVLLKLKPSEIATIATYYVSHPAILPAFRKEVTEAFKLADKALREQYPLKQPGGRDVDGALSAMAALSQDIDRKNTHNPVNISWPQLPVSIKTIANDLGRMNSAEIATVAEKYPDDEKVKEAFSQQAGTLLMRYPGNKRVAHALALMLGTSRKSITKLEDYFMDPVGREKFINTPLNKRTELIISVVTR